jgi:hypothetical protein
VVVDGIEVRITSCRRSAPSRVVVELELSPRHAGSQLGAGARQTRRTASRSPAAERRDGTAVVLATLAGFAVVAIFASLLAILM